MNTLAVFIGLSYGMGAATACYGMAMITSGLFDRSFYRTYARVLIGICSIMLLVPVLRWVASTQPLFGTLGLTAAQYLAMGVLGYGVVRFNREFMKRVFLERYATAYFTFGTLANAAVVTLAFLHVAVSGAATVSGHAFTYVGPGHSGPLIVLLAALVFHTDYWLKKSVNDMRRFSRFTFVGYAISFVGLLLSTSPYFGSALAELGLPIAENFLLENFSCAQALLIAIFLYAWLVWRYESAPPLFLLLLAIVGEYHVLITQWAIRWFGPASWGLASLPLFGGIAALDHYFVRWEGRRRKQSGHAQVPSSEKADEAEPYRFTVPLQIVDWGLLAALLGLTLWTRFVPVRNASPVWLGVTFGAYATYFFALAIGRKNYLLVYVGGFLAALATLLGLPSPGEPTSLVLLSTLSLAWCSLAWIGDRAGLKREYRTALADCSFVSSIVVLTIVLSRYHFGTEPYFFYAVGYLDGVSLLLVALANAICAGQYRSRLPIYGGLIAVAAIAPTLSAGIGFLAMTIAAIIKRRVPQENAISLEDHVLLFGRIRLPQEDVLPELYARPLSLGAIPLSLLGLLISATRIIRGDFSATALGGAAVSSLVLGLLTRVCLSTWPARRPVFFPAEQSLLSFLAVLTLSLLGTAMGIAFRVRLFVYIGLAFLVINVIGQLGLQFHRESGVIRAVILIGVGLFVLSAMIFFNIHRERILRRYRGFLTNAHWE